jgi:hypothetical protein
MIDTVIAFKAAYAVAAVLFIAYVLSLWLRDRRVRQRLESRGRG